MTCRMPDVADQTGRHGSFRVSDRMSKFVHEDVCEAEETLVTLLVSIGMSKRSTCVSNLPKSRLPFCQQPPHQPKASWLA